MPPRHGFPQSRRTHESNSRSHEGLVDVLQLGANESEGYFVEVLTVLRPHLMSTEHSPQTRPRGIPSEPDRPYALLSDRGLGGDEGVDRFWRCVPW